MRFVWLIFILFTSIYGKAGHLVGGELQYTYIGNDRYVIQLTMYRDCYAPASAAQSFDPTANISIYWASNNQLLKVIELPRGLDSTRIPLGLNIPCLPDPPDLCILRMIYTDTIELSIPNGGVVLSNERCCRTIDALNILNPNLQGSTYTAFIPDASTASENSSSVFNMPPPIALCAGIDIELDYSATDPDGDSLYYFFCTPYHGASPGTAGGSPYPDTPAAPPFDTIFWQTNFNVNYQVPSLPKLQINHHTGIVSGRPNQLGTYVFAVCASEYRNNVWIGENRRDFQMTTTYCDVQASAAIDSVIEECIGLEIQFFNRSDIGDLYHWNFGDSTSNSDSSNQTNPSYTFPDTGFYTIQLVASSSNSGCSDTTYLTYHVLPKIDPWFPHPEPNCFDRQHYDFLHEGYLKPTTSVTWDFGDTITTIAAEAVGIFNKQFSTPGDHEVILTYQDFGCTKKYADTVLVFSNPQFELVEPFDEQCAPFVGSYTTIESYAYKPTIVWHVDANTPELTDTFLVTNNSIGYHDLTITLITDSACIDTVSITYKNHILVLDTPIANFWISSLEANMYEPDFTFVDSSQKSSFYEFFIDDDFYSRLKYNKIHLPDTGNYTITEIASHENGCTDTFAETVRVKPEYLVFTPNSFTPNGDGLNDLWFAKVFVWKEFKVEIYDRWGKLVFKTNDPNYGWNGAKWNDNSPCPNGVYAYLIQIIDPNNATWVYDGQIVLNR